MTDSHVHAVLSALLGGVGVTLAAFAQLLLGGDNGAAFTAGLVFATLSGIAIGWALVLLHRATNNPEN